MAVYSFWSSSSNKDFAILVLVKEDKRENTRREAIRQTKRTLNCEKINGPDAQHTTEAARIR